MLTIAVATGLIVAKEGGTHIRHAVLGEPVCTHLLTTVDLARKSNTMVHHFTSTQHRRNVRAFLGHRICHTAVHAVMQLMLRLAPQESTSGCTPVDCQAEC